MGRTEACRDGPFSDPLVAVQQAPSRSSPSNQPITRRRRKIMSTESSMREHTGRIRELVIEASRQARLEIKQVKNPKAQALLETTAEVLDGLNKAYADFEANNEPAWK